MAVIESSLLARAKAGEFIGVITLNKEKSLNALTLEMVQLIAACLDKWRNDDSVVAVFVQGAGDKAFCAGGDVVSLYQAMKDAREQQNIDKGVTLLSPPAFFVDFFTQEYALDYCMHTYPKPIISWGCGIVMGGGLGLFAASKFAIATETSKIAMPEISIGLFPDVGASYFLNQMPPGVGLFLGLSGASLNAIDAVDVKLASHKLSSQSKQDLLDALVSMRTISDTDLNNTLSAMQERDEPSFSHLDAKLAANFAVLSALDATSSLVEIESILTRIVAANENDKWWERALNTLQNGSPITANLILEQLAQSRQLSLADCFRQELSIAIGCSMHGDFEEGVRALLIDKDRAPHWVYKKREEVPVSVIQAHFSFFDGSTHPLKQLEQIYGEAHA